MKPLLIANWKCNPLSLGQAIGLFASVKQGLKSVDKVEAVICPPFVYLAGLKAKASSRLKLGGQDCFWEKAGPFTGEISALMLKNLGCDYVIIGHSEKKRYGRESAEMTANKLSAALKSGLKPILCLGEKSEQVSAAGKRRTIRVQLKKSLKFASAKDYKRLVVAYEPVWAVHSSRSCPWRRAKQTLLFLKRILPESRIVYGGSVDSKNASDYLAKAGFDGLLVGAASLNAKEFIKIAEAINR
jgi:triosephosphate isomerase